MFNPFFINYNTFHLIQFFIFRYVLANKLSFEIFIIFVSISFMGFIKQDKLIIIYKSML